MFFNGRNFSSFNSKTFQPKALPQKKVNDTWCNQSKVLFCSKKKREQIKPFFVCLLACIKKLKLDFCHRLFRFLVQCQMRRISSASDVFKGWVYVGGRTKKLTDVTLFVNVGVFLLIFLNFFSLQLFYYLSLFCVFRLRLTRNLVWRLFGVSSLQPPSLARVHYDDDAFQLCDWSDNSHWVYIVGRGLLLERTS